MKSKKVSEDLRRWFLENKRVLPWREKPSPYRVLISEVMLQQTRAEVVIPYFNRWLKLFPDIESLARADIDQVIKAWEGLGYYSRARSLHETAQILVKEHRGQLPEDVTDLVKLKGIGPYTAAAIASFAYGKKAAPLDGNAMRVLARYSAYDQMIATSRAQKDLSRQFLELLPDQKPWEVAEGVIELGALVCQSQSPKCGICPLRSTCRANQLNQTSHFPIRAKKPKPKHLVRLALIIEEVKSSGSSFVVYKNLTKGVMRDLWEFPHLELLGENADILIHRPTELNLSSVIPDSWALGSVTIKGWTPLVRHSFTSYLVDLRGVYVRLEKCPVLPFVHTKCDVRSFDIEELKKLPFSSGHRRLIKYLETVFEDLKSVNHSPMLFPGGSGRK